MKVRNQLAILFTIITAGILLVFAILIYFSAKQSRENEFYNSLKKEAITKANIFLNAKVDATTLQTIYKNNRETLNEVEVAIYDTSFQLLYHDAMDIDFVKEKKSMISEIQTQKEIRFYQGKWQVVGLLFPFEGRDYIITAAAYDQYGYTKLRNLTRTLLIAFICSIIIIYLAGRFFAKRAFSPITEMTKKANEISATNLNLRLNTRGSKDELTELAKTFNDMLARLESSFDAQKDFVSNISHELRTPLTTMLAELQLMINSPRTDEEYKEAIKHTIEDAQRLVRLSNSLLDLAKANYDQSEIAFRNVRIDEILLDARNDLLHLQPNYTVNIIFEKEIEDESLISIHGNEYLLKVAFTNLMENGCKFSEAKESTVRLTYTSEKVILNFQDSGVGIDEQELANIFTPFYRGKNKDYASGNGIGLSLTQKIIDLHKGNISVTSNINKGSNFTIALNHL